MARWLYRIRLKHLLNDGSTYAEVQAAMTSIAEVIDRSKAFIGFSTAKLRAIPVGDETFQPLDYANRYLNELHDFADARRIWIE